MSRKLYLKNSEGQTLYIGERSNLITGYTGFGLEYKNTYNSSEGYHILETSELKQGKATMSILLGSESSEKGYPSYHEFSKFILHQPFTLIYSADDIEEYMRDCRLSKITKSSKIKGGLLDEDLELEFTSPWYKYSYLKTTEYTDQVGDGKFYANQTSDNNVGYYLYDYVYDDFIDRDKQCFYFSSTIDSNFPVEISIEAVKGNIIDPSWDVYVDGRIVQSDGYEVTILQGSTLFVSSEPLNKQAKILGEVETNIYQTQMMTKTNFVNLPGRGCMLFFNNVGSNRISCRIKEEVQLI